jgi:hypothetical protein
MAGLAKLLAFADAVGSITGLLKAIDVQAAAAPLVAEVPLGEQQLQLAADSCYFVEDKRPLILVSSSAGRTVTVATASTAEDVESMRQQFVQQLEALLYLVYKLQLPQMQRVMRRCISCNSSFANSLLKTADDVRSVMSARVVDAAAGSGAAQDALIASSSNELCAFRGGKPWHQLFTPLNLTAAQAEPLKFKAEVREDVLSWKKGQNVRIELDLFATSMMRVALDEPHAVAFPSVASLSLGRQLQPLAPSGSGA